MPIPTHIESIERAIDKNKASLLSILLELSKSEEVAYLIIFVVIPNIFVFSLTHFLSYFNALIKIKITIIIKIKLPK